MSQVLGFFFGFLAGLLIGFLSLGSLARYAGRMSSTARARNGLLLIRYPLLIILLYFFVAYLELNVLGIAAGYTVVFVLFLIRMTKRRQPGP
jgi:hypothetical protein